MTPARVNGVEHPCWLGEVRALVDAVDQAVYDTVAGTPTPRLDRQLVGVSTAANYSRLWLVTAAAMAVAGGAPGRRAARQAVLAVALASAVTNLVLKPLARRQRPARSDRRPVSDSRRVRRPVSPSFPCPAAFARRRRDRGLFAGAHRCALPVRRGHRGRCRRGVWSGGVALGNPPGGCVAPRR
jgi:hypothetical protein